MNTSNTCQAGAIGQTLSDIINTVGTSHTCRPHPTLFSTYLKDPVSPTTAFFIGRASQTKRCPPSQQMHCSTGVALFLLRRFLLHQMMARRCCPMTRLQRHCPRPRPPSPIPWRGPGRPPSPPLAQASGTCSSWEAEGRRKAGGEAEGRRGG